MNIEEQSFNAVKRKFIFSLLLLAAGIIYTVWPIDIIPDILGPVGWLDDLSILAASAVWSARSYFKLKKMKEGEEA